MSGVRYDFHQAVMMTVIAGYMDNNGAVDIGCYIATHVTWSENIEVSDVAS